MTVILAVFGVLRAGVAKDKGLLCGEVRGDLRTLEMSGTTNPTTQLHTPGHLNSRQSYFSKSIFFLGGKKKYVLRAFPSPISNFQTTSQF